MYKKQQKIQKNTMENKTTTNEEKKRQIYNYYSFSYGTFIMIIIFCREKQKQHNITDADAIHWFDLERMNKL